MLESSDLLLSYLRGLREESGATAVSLYVPAVSGTAVGPALLHEGGGEPPAELRRARDGVDPSTLPTTPADLGTLPSETAGALLVPLPPQPSAWSMLARRPTAPLDGERERRRPATENAELPTAWLGFRFDTSTPDDPPVPYWLLAMGSRVVAGTAHARSALIDPVTELPGRLGFEALLRDELERARATPAPLALLLCHPVDFSEVNERYGPQGGDRVLFELGILLSSSLRASDAIARFGGAIFAAVLPATSSEEARIVAERIAATVADTSFLDGTVELAVRIGAVGCTVEALPDRAVELIRRADRALNTAHAEHRAVALWRAPGSDEGSLDGGDNAVLSTGDLARDYRNIALLRDTVRIGASGEEDLATIVEETLERVFSAVHPERLGLFTAGDSSTELLQAVVSRPGARRQTTRRLPLTAKARETLEAALATGATRHGTTGGERRRLVWAFPLVAREKPLGALYLEGKAESLDVGPEDLSILEAVAAHLATVVERYRLAELGSVLRRRRAGSWRGALGCCAIERLSPGRSPNRRRWLPCSRKPSASPPPPHRC